MGGTTLVCFYPTLRQKPFHDTTTSCLFQDEAAVHLKNEAYTKGKKNI